MSEAFLLDTDVASYLFKGDTRAERFRPLVSAERVAVSFATVAELYRWAVQWKWGAPRIIRLESTLLEWAIIPYERNLAWTWARVTAACATNGTPIAPGDAWVAATGIEYNLPLITNNVRDFVAAEKLCGLKLVRA